MNEELTLLNLQKKLEQLGFGSAGSITLLKDNFLIGSDSNLATEISLQDLRQILDIQTSGDELEELRLQNKSEIPTNDTNRSILCVVKDSTNIQKLYFIDSENNVKELTSENISLSENYFLVGDENNISKQITSTELKQIIDLDIIDEDGTIKSSSLNVNVTQKGNTFNEVGTLVLLDTDLGLGARYPALDGSQIFNILISNIKDSSDITLSTILDNKLNLDSTLDITKIEDDNNVSLPTLLNDKADTSSLGLIDDNGVQKYEKITMRYGEYHDGLESGGFACFKSFYEKANVFGVRRNDHAALALSAANGAWWAYGFNTISDKRLKKDIKDISIETIDKLSKIKPKTFIYDGISDDVHIGYIAQELEQAGLDFIINETLEEQEFKTQDEAKEHFEKVKKQGFKPKIEKNANDYLVTYNKKGVKYNEIAVLQQALINDLQSVLKTQNLFFSIDDIDKVYNNIIDNTYEVLTKENNLIKSIEKNDNSQHKRIIEFIKNGGKVEDKIDKQEIIKKVNKICKENISSSFSLTDQINLDRDCLHLKAIQSIDATKLTKEELSSLKQHEKMKKEINKQIKTAKQIKTNIKNLSKDDLINFDKKDLEKWEKSKIYNLENKSILQKALDFVGLGK